MSEENRGQKEYTRRVVKGLQQVMRYATAAQMSIKAGTFTPEAEALVLVEVRKGIALVRAGNDHEKADELERRVKELRKYPR